MAEDFVVGPVYDYVGPLRLVFEGQWRTPDRNLPEELRRIQEGHWAPIRPVEAAAVITAIEEIYLAGIRHDLPPRRYQKRLDWAVNAHARSLTLRVKAIRLGSPLHIVLDIPPPAYVPAFAFFAYGLAKVFGMPYRAAAIFERAREDYFNQRLDTAEAKDRWLDYKANRAARESQFRLRAVDAEPLGDSKTVEKPIQSEEDPDNDSP